MSDWTAPRPCGTCPWRRSSTVGGGDIPGFDLDLMRRLAITVGAEDGWRPMMACHHSPETDERPCVGYLAQEGMSNLTVRLAAAQGSIPLAEIQQECAGLDLWPDFGQMLAAYENATAR